MHFMAKNLCDNLCNIYGIIHIVPSNWHDINLKNNVFNILARLV